jgi:ABC-type transport system involved in multi-copper enzyme maturation permease subunit
MYWLLLFLLLMFGFWFILCFVFVVKILESCVKEIQDQEQQSTPTSNLVHIQPENDNSSQPKLHSFFTNFPLNQQQSYSYFAENHSSSYQATSHHSAEVPSS